MELNREELSIKLEAVRSGDMTAFEEIYNDLKTPVYTVIVRVTHNETAAEDILQEVFIKLYRSPPAQDVVNPRAYIFRMARNLAIDGIKKLRPDASLDEIGDTLGSDERDIPLSIDVETALASLAVQDCQIVTLHINGGLKFREVSEIMELPLGTVLWRYRLALSELRGKLSGGVL